MAVDKQMQFSQEALNEIFKVSSIAPDRVISREGSSLEFKEAFEWGSLSKYLKTKPTDVFTIKI